MSGLSFRGFTYMLLIAFLIWSFNFEACIARRGKHWRQSRDVSASVYKKKGKNYGNAHNKYHGGGSKSKPPSSHKGTPTLPKPPPQHKNTPSPPYPTPPSDDTPTTPPPKGYNGGGHSPTTTFNVLDFGAKGDGKSDDTKVNSFCTLLHSANGFDVNSANKFNMQD